jgi:adenine phosphoribosyltransferase
MNEVFKVDINGVVAELPVLPLPSGINIAFFNLHGNQKLTEHCAKSLAQYVKDCDVLITAESKGLQLTHCVAREIGHEYYAVARKSKKLYMQDGIEVAVKSITTGDVQHLYLSQHDVNLIKGKKVGIVDDVISTGGSLQGLVDLIAKAGGILEKKVFVLAEGDDAYRTDITFLATIPLL